jgi:hypothetical protein
MLTALIEGERDVHVLAEMAKARMRPKIPQLVEAVAGNFAEHHAFLCRLHLERIDQLSAAILELSARVEDQMRPFARHLEQPVTLSRGRPGHCGGHHRRDWRRHEPVPHRRPPGLVGWGLPGAP